jgi:hypothetical protein
MKEEQLREDQRREALARTRSEEPQGEETLPPPAAVRAEEPAPRAYEPASQPAPRVAEPAPQPAPRAEPAQPKVDSKVLLESAGLVMIETDRSRVAAPAPTQEEPQQHLGRPRRERPKSTAQDEELKQVETKR